MKNKWDRASAIGRIFVVSGEFAFSFLQNGTVKWLIYSYMYTH